MINIFEIILFPKSFLYFEGNGDCDRPKNVTIQIFQKLYYFVSTPGHPATGYPSGQNNGQFLLNRRPYFSTIKPTGLPSTPLVKQKTTGCASPRVQMYRTRVVYSDARDAIQAQEAAV